MVTRPRSSPSQGLSVWVNGQRVGRWRVTASGDDEFRYEPSWMESSQGRPLSLSLPFAEKALHRGEVVRNYFDNLLPDSESIRQRLAARFQTRSAGTFDLLRAIGRDCVGAIQLLGDDESPEGLRRIEGTPLDEAAIEQLLRHSVDGRSEEGLGHLGDELRISLAGAQEKTALLWHGNQWLKPHGATPTTHILKLPLGLVGHRRADFGASVENEWLCLQLLAAFGIEVPRCAILRFGAQKVLAVERFDRRMHSSGQWILRLPQEDFCQALGLPSHLKYQADGGPGVVDLARVLRHSIHAREDIATLLKTQLLFWMLGAPDGHAKNFSLQLLAGGRYKLAPLYDVMSLWPVEGTGPNQFSWHEAKLAMAIIGKNRHYHFKTVQRRHFNAMAASCFHGVDAEDLIGPLIESVDGAIDRVAALVPSGFPARVADTVFAGLRRSARQLAGMQAF